MELDLDISSFERAAKFVVENTPRDGATTLNKAGLQTITGSKGYPGAIQLTPKADPVAIKAKLTGSDAMALRIVYTRAKRAGKVLTREEAIKAAKALVRARQRASAYTRGPGWNNAAQALGGRGVRVNERFPKSEARHGRGSRANPRVLIAEIINTAPAGAKIGLKPLQKALDNQAKDMMDYGHRQLQKTLDKVNT